jgi:UDP-N-acetylglucosamine transferase subunit ALG13
VILVTVGTNEARFDRLLQGVDRLAAGEELVVQHGPSLVRPARATCVDYLPFDELVALLRRSRVVVTHAGVGSVMTALTNGRRPIVVPRLARYGEAVDDHQLPFARRLDGAGVVRLVHDPTELPSALSQESGMDATAIRPDRQLVRELRAYLEENSRAPAGGRE